MLEFKKNSKYNNYAKHLLPRFSDFVPVENNTFCMGTTSSLLNSLYLMLFFDNSSQTEYQASYRFIYWIGKQRKTGEALFKYFIFSVAVQRMNVMLTCSS